MAVAVITGSAGLIGAEAARFFAARGLDIVGIDNDMRAEFFGPDASTVWSRRRLEAELTGYRHYDIDIRDQSAISDLFERYKTDIAVVIHTAAQPSHDWAAKAPFVDFSINANGTLNLLEATRQYCPDACFVFTSTNKVYGDTPNRLPLIEQSTRWELVADHRYGAYGIDESMSIDQTMHSLFWRLQSGRRRPGARIRALFRYENRLLPRRLPHWSGPFGGAAAWLSRLSREMRGYQCPLCRVRL